MNSPSLGKLAAFAATLALAISLSSAPVGRALAADAVPAAMPDASRAAFIRSLALRPDRVVADSTHAAFGWLAQTAPVAYAAPRALQLRLALAPESAPAPVKDLGTFTIYGGDLAEGPFPFSADLAGVPDGQYRYVAEVFDGDTSLARLEKPVVLVAGLDEQQAAITRRLANITGHEGAKAGVLYPFDLARVINLGKRVYGSGTNNPEFGLNQAGVQVPYDFTAGLKKSADVLAALEAGRDPLWRAGGETVQYYHMAEADEILPYHVFVPSTWDGHAALPLVFILHGNWRDQDFYFDRDEHIIPKAAEKHGFMLVAPLGYAPNAGYNYVPFNRERGERGVAAAAAAPETFGPAPAATAGGGGRRGGGAGRGGGAAGSFGGVNGSTTPQMVRTEWSEQDAMHVFDLIKAEYPIDPKRTFLFGYSAGGQGAHYIGPKYAGNWAAIAIGGSNAQPGPAYQFDRVKSVPYFLFYGTADPTNGPPATAMAQALREHGTEVVLKSYPGANHDATPSAAIADVFDFFDTHTRK